MKRSTVKTCLMTTFAAAAIATSVAPLVAYIHHQKGIASQIKQDFQQVVSSQECFESVVKNSSLVIKRCTEQDMGKIDSYRATLAEKKENVPLALLAILSLATMGFGALVLGNKIDDKLDTWANPPPAPVSPPAPEEPAAAVIEEPPYVFNPALEKDTPAPKTLNFQKTRSMT